jgi:hypothetical protein
MLAANTTDGSPWMVKVQPTDAGERISESPRRESGDVFRSSLLTQASASPNPPDGESGDVFRSSLLTQASASPNPPTGSRGMCSGPAY